MPFKAPNKPYIQLNYSDNSNHEGLSERSTWVNCARIQGIVETETEKVRRGVPGGGAEGI